MQPEIVDWEPDAALFDRGQTAEIVEMARDYLRPGAALALELADGSAARVREHLEANGFVNVRVTRDFAGIERVVEARRP